MVQDSFRESIRTQVRAKYAHVARSAANRFKYPVGAESVDRLGYPQEIVRSLPDEASQHFCGVGNPFLLGGLHPGERVLDVGCGAGFDSLVAASMVGPSGSVVGIDLTEPMLERARANLRATSFSNVRFLLAGGETIPLPDHSANVVISNGAINLSPDKPQVLSEIYRVTRPAGCLMIADMFLEEGVARETVAAMDAWSD